VLIPHLHSVVTEEDGIPDVEEEEERAPDEDTVLELKITFEGFEAVSLSIPPGGSCQLTVQIRNSPTQISRIPYSCTSHDTKSSSHPRT
jgi:hypothetical protein